MEKQILEKLKEELYKKREDLFNLVTKNNGVIEREVGDSIDVAADSAEKELMFELNDHERVLLNEIDNAIKKIEHDLYGQCEECGLDISEARLKVIPAARHCIKCQQKMEYDSKR
ncbi:MAG: TraR/DksA family transcriptional regulator [bacterium]|nr:TraR/DksA family transcriptional regulator [bacterium]